MQKNDSQFALSLRRLLCQIPSGQFTTYKELARQLKSSPRAVGQALKRNPLPVVVPCHRVVCSDFSLGGYCGVMNSDKKIKLLQTEGLSISEGRVVSVDKLFVFE